LEGIYESGEWVLELPGTTEIKELRENLLKNVQTARMY
jgi:hypothetical protein